MALISDRDFSQRLTDLLTEAKCAELLELFAKESNQSNISNNIVSIISSLSSHLDSKDPELSLSCCQALNLLADQHDQTDVILGILQQLENDQTDVKYCSILGPLLRSLTRESEKTPKFLDWTIGSIKSYVSGIPHSSDTEGMGDAGSEEYQFDKIQVERIYQRNLQFLGELQSKLGGSQNHVLSTVLFMLGPPFCYFEDKVWDSKVPSLTRKMMDLSLSLCPDAFRLLSIIERRSRKQIKKDCADNLFDSEEQIPNLAFGQFYWLLFSNEGQIETMPQVYHPEYLLNNILFLAKAMLERNNYPKALLLKGLRLAKEVLERVERESVGPGVLELRVHWDFLGVVTKLMIYCDHLEVRTLGLEVFKAHIGVFRLEARYRMVRHLYKSEEHPGLVGLVTSILKNSVVQCLDEGRDVFLGGNLRNLLLEQTGKLKERNLAESVEMSDEIVTMLNLLLFLVLRDRENKTGVWDYMEQIEKGYLKYLRDGIEYSRAYWKEKISSLETEKKSKNVAGSESISVQVGNEDLKMLPTEQKMGVCYNALNALDIMHSVLSRVNKCLENRVKEKREL